MTAIVENPFDCDRLDAYEPFALKLNYSNPTLRSEFYMVMAIVGAGWFPTIVERSHPAGGTEGYTYLGPRMEYTWGLSTRDWPRVRKAVEQLRRKQRVTPWPRHIPEWSEPVSNTDRTHLYYVPWTHQLEYAGVATGRSAYLVGYPDGQGPGSHFIAIVLRQQRAGQATPTYQFLGPNKYAGIGLTANDITKLTKEVERYQTITLREQLIGGYQLEGFATEEPHAHTRR